MIPGERAPGVQNDINGGSQGSSPLSLSTPPIERSCEIVPEILGMLIAVPAGTSTVHDRSSKHSDDPPQKRFPPARYII